MRRILPLAVTGLVLLSACSDDTDDAASELTLETIAVTVDRCDDDYVAPETTAGAETIAADDTTEAGDTTDAGDTTEADGTAAPETTEDPYAAVPEVALPEELPTELERTVLEEGPSDGREARDGDVVS